MLSSLEPLFGLALAFNLAYLNLPIFSFISVISREVKECLNEVPEGARDSVADTPWYKDAVEISKIYTLRSIDLKSPSVNWVKFKSPINSLIFNVLFQYRVGRILSCVAVAYCCLGLTLGVYGDIGGSNPAMQTLISLYGIPFSAAVLGLLWPILVVTSGAWVRYSTMKELMYNLRDLGLNELNAADNALSQVEAEVKSAQSKK